MRFPCNFFNNISSLEPFLNILFGLTGVGLRAVAGKGRSSKLLLWHDLMHDCSLVSLTWDHLLHRTSSQTCNAPREGVQKQDFSFIFKSLYIFLLAGYAHDIRV